MAWHVNAQKGFWSEAVIFFAEGECLVGRHLIIGGAGFIGSHLARALHRAGDDVLVLSRRAPVQTNASDLLHQIPILFADFSAVDWADILAPGDTIYHCASSTTPQSSNDDPIADLEVNVKGTLRLLQALRGAERAKIIFISSGGTVYGPLTVSRAPESHPLEPITAYGVAKVAIEKYLGYFRTHYDLDARVVRLANPFGPGQNPEKRQGAATLLLYAALDKRTIEIWGDGSTVRDFIYIDDVVSSLIAVATPPKKVFESKFIFNIGSGKGTSLSDILSYLRKNVDSNLSVIFKPARSFDVPSNVLDITLAREMLQWSPTVDFTTGMNLTLEHLALHNENFARFLQQAAADIA